VEPRLGRALSPEANAKLATLVAGSGLGKASLSTTALG
jgi:hypothetical protein